MAEQERIEIGFIESCDVPSVYSNKQSYYEVLCYINYKLNQLIDVYNSLEFDYKTYVDSQLDAVREYADEQDEKHSTADRAYTDLKANNARDTAKAYADELNRKMSDRVSDDEKLIADNTTKIGQLRTDLTQESITREGADKLLEQKIIALETMVTTRFAQLKDYVDKADLATKNWFNSELELMKQWVEEHYQKTYTLKNPWRGYKTDLQSCINDIFSVYRPLSMSCSQLDNIIPEITYIDNENLSCNDFDFNGLRVKQYLSDAYMHNPFTGEYQKIQEVIAWFMYYVAHIRDFNTSTIYQVGSVDYSIGTLEHLLISSPDLLKIDYLDNLLNQDDNALFSVSMRGMRMS